MITRGHIIGKIVDDLAGLKYQVDTRNKLGLFDMTKICEDFFKDLINIIYGLNLNNLNRERNNNPGIDLGDLTKKKAFQITSTKTSQKVIETIEAITDQQKVDYNDFKIFIVGKRQTSYSIAQAVLDTISFDPDNDIIDIDFLLKDIVLLETDKLDMIFSLFKREFRQLRIELEPIDQNGDFESSLYHNIEQVPNKKPNNANKLSESFDDEDFNYETITDLYRRLSETPRITRELISIIAERGECRGFNHIGDEWGILPQKLRHIVRMTDQELQSELAILMDAELIYYAEEEIEEQRFHYITLAWETINQVVNWAKEKKISLKVLFNTMDWTIMDE